MITKSYLEECLSYDSITGVVRWKMRPLHHFNSLRYRNSWCAKYAGRAAGGLNNGYIATTINGKFTLVHRIAWLLTYGEWPENIDHINGNRSDNRLLNLRSVSVSENCRNLKQRKGTKSGAIGVSWKPSKALGSTGGKWHAKIQINGKTFHIGSFKTIEDAREARSQASLEHGYHKNHGRSS